MVIPASVVGQLWIAFVCLMAGAVAGFNMAQPRKRKPRPVETEPGFEA